MTAVHVTYQIPNDHNYQILRALLVVFRSISNALRDNIVIIGLDAIFRRDPEVTGDKKHE